MNKPFVQLPLNNVNPKWIFVEWSGLAFDDWSLTGGDDIIYYELEWDKGTAGADWTVVTTQTPDLKYSFNVTSETVLPSGSVQRFRARAMNGVGIGLYSDILEVVADQVPQFMNVPQVNYRANDINPKSIRLTWDPLDSTDWTKTGGDEVIYYEV